MAISERMRQTRIDKAIAMIDELAPAGEVREWLVPWLKGIKGVLEGECAPGECDSGYKESDCRDKMSGCYHKFMYDTFTALAEQKLFELLGEYGISADSMATQPSGNVIHTFSIIERKD